MTANKPARKADAPIAAQTQEIVELAVAFCNDHLDDECARPAAFAPAIAVGLDEALRFGSRCRQSQ